MNKNTNNDYIDDFVEYQRKQFQPGEYTGGKMPPWVKYPSRKVYGYFTLSFLIAFVSSLFSWFEGGDVSLFNKIGYFVYNIIFLIMFILFLRKFLSQKGNQRGF